MFRTNFVNEIEQIGNDLYKRYVILVTTIPQQIFNINVNLIESKILINVEDTMATPPTYAQELDTHRMVTNIINSRSRSKCVIERTQFINSLCYATPEMGFRCSICLGSEISDVIRLHCCSQQLHRKCVVRFVKNGGDKCVLCRRPLFRKSVA